MSDENLKAHRLRINRREIDVRCETDAPLLWVLRADLGLTGTKYGCGAALCGSCTVHLEGAPTRACVVPVGAVGDRAVTTIEGLASPQAQALREAWLTLQVSQCGYCQAGQLMSAEALLRANPTPDDSAIDAAMSGNLCRCGTYPRIRAAIKAAAQALKAPSASPIAPQASAAADAPAPASPPSASRSR